MPFIDMAYQGLGTGIAEDAFGVRLFCAELPEVTVAVSCSKNFGLYRERTGALHVVSEKVNAADAVLTQLVRIARSIYSMPPDHGAAIAYEILDNSGLREMWTDELTTMRKRIQGLRHDVVHSCGKSVRNGISVSSNPSEACFPTSGSPWSRCASCRAVTMST